MSRARRPASEERSFDDLADELYSLPPEEFITRRDELVREAKETGDRDAAAAISALRKPSNSAWLANQLVRARADDVAALLDLGESLRQAQADLAGDQLRELATQRRKVVNTLVQQAKGLARELGRPATDDVARQLEQTLEAALASPDAAVQLRRARLSGPLERGGGFESQAPRLQVVQDREKQSGRRKAGQTPQRTAAQVAAKQPDPRAKARLDEAVTAAREATRELTARLEARDAAAEEAKAVREQIADLRAQLREVERQLRQAEERQREAKRQEQLAKQAVSEAERSAQRANVAVDAAQARLDRPGLPRT